MNFEFGGLTIKSCRDDINFRNSRVKCICFFLFGNHVKWKCSNFYYDKFYKDIAANPDKSILIKIMECLVLFLIKIIIFPQLRKQTSFKVFERWTCFPFCIIRRVSTFLKLHDESDFLVYATISLFISSQLYAWN